MKKGQNWRTPTFRRLDKNRDGWAVKSLVAAGRSAEKRETFVATFQRRLDVAFQRAQRAKGDVYKTIVKWGSGDEDIARATKAADMASLRFAKVRRSYDEVMENLLFMGVDSPA